MKSSRRKVALLVIGPYRFAKDLASHRTDSSAGSGSKAVRVRKIGASPSNRASPFCWSSRKSIGIAILIECAVTGTSVFCKDHSICEFTEQNCKRPLHHHAVAPPGGLAGGAGGILGFGCVTGIVGTAGAAAGSGVGATAGKTGGATGAGAGRICAAGGEVDDGEFVRRL